MWVEGGVGMSVANDLASRNPRRRKAASAYNPVMSIYQYNSLYYNKLYVFCKIKSTNVHINGGCEGTSPPARVYSDPFPNAALRRERGKKS
jgi:hypothetical protein